jgi:hypothetical protein
VIALVARVYGGGLEAAGAMTWREAVEYAEIALESEKRDRREQLIVASYPYADKAARGRIWRAFGGAKQSGPDQIAEAVDKAMKGKGGE